MDMKRVEEIERMDIQLHKDKIDFLTQNIKQQQEQIERYEKVLEFYGNEENYKAKFTDEYWQPIVAVNEDEGFIARKALEKS